MAAIQYVQHEQLNRHNYLPSLKRSNNLGEIKNKDDVSC